MGLTKVLLTVLVLQIVTLGVNSATAGGRRLLEDDISANLEQAGEDLNSFMDSIWGGKCFTDDQCAATVAYCAKDEGDWKITAIVGACRPTWWIWVVVGVLILLLLSACLCCICLCSCCSCILDILCCCCRNKGYSPAGTG